MDCPLLDPTGTGNVLPVNQTPSGQSLAALDHQRGNRPEINNPSDAIDSVPFEPLCGQIPAASPRLSYAEAVASIKLRVPRGLRNLFKINFIRKDISFILDESLTAESCILVAPTGFGKTHWIQCLSNIHSRLIDLTTNYNVMQVDLSLLRDGTITFASLLNNTFKFDLPDRHNFSQFMDALRKYLTETTDTRPVCLLFDTCEVIETENLILDVSSIMNVLGRNPDNRFYFASSRPLNFLSVPVLQPVPYLGYTLAEIGEKFRDYLLILAQYPPFNEKGSPILDQIKNYFDRWPQSMLLSYKDETLYPFSAINSLMISGEFPQPPNLLPKPLSTAFASSNTYSMPELIQKICSTLSPSLSSSPLISTPFLDRKRFTIQLWNELCTYFNRFITNELQKPMVFISGNMSGMGKTSFGLKALECLKTHLSTEISPTNLQNFLIKDKSGTHKNVDILPFLNNSLHIHINCNNGSSADNYNPTQGDFDQPKDWIASRLLSRGILNSPGCQFLEELPKSAQKPLNFSVKHVLIHLVARHRSKLNLSDNTPMMIFIHFDEFPYLLDCLLKVNLNYQPNKFLGKTISDFTTLTYSFLQRSVYLVFFMTATMTPDMKILEITGCSTNHLSLDLLDPDMVFEYLLQKFPSHPLMKDAKNPQSATARYWRVLLRDIGVVPIFFNIIYEALEQEHSTRDIIEIKLNYEGSKRVPAEFESKIFLDAVVSGQALNLDQRIGEQTLHEITKTGQLLYHHVDAKHVKIYIPIVLLCGMLALVSSSFTQLCKFPCPNPGVDYEKMVFCTILARLRFGLPATSITLPHIFKGLIPLLPLPPKNPSDTSGDPSDTSDVPSDTSDDPSDTSDDPSDNQIILPNSQSHTDDLDLQLEILIPKECFYDPHPKMFPPQLPSNTPKNIIYITNPCTRGIDGFIYFTLQNGKNLWVLLQIKSSGSQSRPDCSRFFPAIDEFIRFRNDRSIQNEHVVLIFITQQIIPSTLQQKPYFPISGVYSIPHDKLAEFALPNTLHRFSLSDVSPNRAIHVDPPILQLPSSSSSCNTVDDTGECHNDDDSNEVCDDDDDDDAFSSTSNQTIQVDPHMLQLAYKLLLTFAKRNSLPAENEDNVFSRLSTRLNTFGLLDRVGQVLGDGNCCFSSIGALLGKPQATVRSELVGWLRPRRELLDFVPLYSSWDAYVDSMGNDGTWADHLVILAAAEYYNRQIIIISSSVDPTEELKSRFVFRINPTSSVDQSPPAQFILAHRSDWHYDPIFQQPPSEKHTKLAQVQLERQSQPLNIYTCIKHDIKSYRSNDDQSTLPSTSMSFSRNQTPRIDLKKIGFPDDNSQTNLQRKLVCDRLHSLGLQNQLIEVPGDGNCFFTSIGLLTGESSSQVRSNLVDWLRANPHPGFLNHPLLSFTVSSSWNHYCARMSQDTTWADHVVLVAAAEFYQRNLVIIGPVHTTIISSHPPKPENPFTLVHRPELHYDPIIPRDPTHTPPSAWNRRRILCKELPISCNFPLVATNRNNKPLKLTCHGCGGQVDIVWNSRNEGNLAAFCQTCQLRFVQEGSAISEQGMHEITFLIPATSQPSAPIPDLNNSKRSELSEVPTEPISDPSKEVRCKVTGDRGVCGGTDHVSSRSHKCRYFKQPKRITPPVDTGAKRSKRSKRSRRQI